MALVEGLPPEGLFKSTLEDRPAVSEVSAAVADVFQVLTGKQWPRWNALRKQREEAEFKALLDQERVEARKHNRIYLQSQKRNID